MPKNTPIAEVMTTKLQTADLRDSLESVRALLLRESFHHVPILDGQRLVGIISSRDLIRVHREFRSDDPTADPGSIGTSISKTMETELVTMRPDESVEKAIDLLADGAIHSVLVVGADDVLVGIATNLDLLEFLFA